MTPLEIGLLSATIGGLSGILSQIISKILHDQTDNKKTIRNIISEERRLAYLIRQNSHSLYANDLNCTYLKLQGEFLNGTYKEKNFNLVNEYNVIHDKLFDKHADLIGEYLKNINEFTFLCNCHEKLDIHLGKIISERYLDKVDLQEQHANIESLMHEYKLKHSTLRNKAIEYGKMFDEVGALIQGIVKVYEID